jgi:hypothetical protein
VFKGGIRPGIRCAGSRGAVRAAEQGRTLITGRIVRIPYGNVHPGTGTAGRQLRLAAAGNKVQQFSKVTADNDIGRRPQTEKNNPNHQGANQGNGPRAADKPD